MTTKKLTDWFDGEVKPVHPGVYARKFLAINKVVYSKWDGKQWLSYCQTPELAEGCTRTSLYQHIPWRGLAENPNERRPGLAKIAARLAKLHPLWSDAKVLAEAKKKWEVRQLKKKGGM